MTKFRHIPGIKLLKNVSSSTTSHELDKNLYHNIFFIDKYFFYEFSMSFGIFFKFQNFPGLENKMSIVKVFHDA